MVSPWRQPAAVCENLLLVCVLGIITKCLCQYALNEPRSCSPNGGKSWLILYFNTDIDLSLALLHNGGAGWVFCAGFNAEGQSLCGFGTKRDHSKNVGNE